jgi:hypothetical protein
LTIWNGRGDDQRRLEDPPEFPIIWPRGHRMSGGRADIRLEYPSVPAFPEMAASPLNFAASFLTG